jgi:hypothetical protein
MSIAPSPWWCANTSAELSIATPTFAAAVLLTRRPMTVGVAIRMPSAELARDSPVILQSMYFS